MLQRIALLILLSSASLAIANSEEPKNVNSRYRVESVRLNENLQKRRLSSALRSDLDNLIGKHFDPQTVTDLAERIHREVHLVVAHRVEKGDQPEHVRVVYESQPRRWDEDEARVTKAAYHQKQGWTGGLEMGFNAGRNRFEFGLESDADQRIERFAGINGAWALHLTPRARFRFDWDATHQQWNRSTLEALQTRSDVPGIYRERFTAQPGVAFELAPGLTWSTGVRITHVQTQFPAAIFEAANAVATTLRHRRRWGSRNSGAGHEEDAGYSLRAATRSLGSDFVYTRHALDGGYSFRNGRHHASLRVGAGVASGRVPLFDRFSLGDTRTLRGWNKFDIAPLGGTRMAHGSVSYRYGVIGLFYDSGAVWDSRETTGTRHSVGMTLAAHAVNEGPFLTVAFPIRNGSYVPLFMMGMYF